jgi:hypothetical protein
MSHPFQPDDDAGFRPLVPTLDTLLTPMVRGISHVEDGRPGQGGAIRAAEAVLDPLDAKELTLLRRAEYTARREGTALFSCAVCSGPVHTRVRGVLETCTSGGRRAYFVHDPRSIARYCPCGNLSDGNSPAMIDAMRFAGRQEGQRHVALKLDLLDALQRDPMFSDVGVERTVRDAQGNWRRPDVLAQTPFGPIGFDVQLAPPLLDSIIGRQDFYKGAGVGHLWIVDAANPGCLSRQGFLDVVMPEGGFVLGFDEKAAAVTADNGELILHLMNLSEDDDRRRFIVSSEFIGFWNWPVCGLRPPCRLPLTSARRRCSWPWLKATGAACRPALPSSPRAAASAVFPRWRTMTSTA